jgi:TolB protein
MKRTALLMAVGDGTHLRKVVLVAVGTLLAACLVALVGTAKPGEAAFPGANGKIAFDAWRGTASDGGSVGTLDADIFSMNPDGSGQRQLTDTVWFNFDPAWSADGTKIAFTNQIAEDSSGGVDTYLMDADGSDEVNLTRSDFAYESHDPAWFPSGSKIVHSRRDSSGTNLYTVAFDELGNVTGTVQLTTSGGGRAAVSPDGRKIAFVRDSNIYVIGANQSEGTANPAVRLTNTSLDGAPNWSPDGTHIAYHRFSNDFFNSEIIVMNADGSGKKNITRSSVLESSPAWSPSGKQIAFVSPKGGDDEIFRMRADGSNRTQLTFNNRDDGSPDWQPLP